MKKQQQLFKKITVSGLVLLLALGGATSAFADGKGRGHDKNEHGKAKAERKGEIVLRLDFEDLGVNWAWASKSIANLAIKRVFDGYGDGTFRPKKPITQLEAIIAAVRLLGLREEAESAAKMNTELNFKDAKKIEQKYPQAVGYVAVAVEHDLFAESDTSVQPEKPADRLWATTLLIKALKLETEAKAKMNAQLDFKDADQIPAGSVGYVAVAIEKGLIYGYNNNTFRPNQPVTRAELAALLDRTGEQMPDYDAHAIRGTVSVAVSGNVLTLTKGGTTQQLNMDPNAFIFRDGVKVAASALQPGDQVLVRTYNNYVIFVEVIDSDDAASNFSGTVSTAVDSNVLTMIRNGQTVQYAIAENAEIYIKALKANAAALQAGDEIRVRTENNAVVYVQATKLAEVDTDFTGTVSAAVYSNVLTVVRDGQTQQYAVNSDTYVYRNGAKVNAADLQVGDEVFVRTRNNTAVFIEVKTAAQANASFNGVLTSTVSNRIVAISKNGVNAQYTIDENANIYVNGLKVSASALQIGDEVFVLVENNEIVLIQVTKLAETSSNITGTINQVLTQNVITVSSGSNQPTPYVVDTNAAIYRNGAKINTSGLEEGDEIFARAQNNLVVFIQVTDPVE